MPSCTIKSAAGASAAAEDPPLRSEADTWNSGPVRGDGTSGTGLDTGARAAAAGHTVLLDSAGGGR